MKVQAMIFNKKFLKASLVLSVLLSGKEVLASGNCQISYNALTQGEYTSTTNLYLVANVTDITSALSDCQANQSNFPKIDVEANINNYTNIYGISNSTKHYTLDNFQDILKFLSNVGDGSLNIQLGDKAFLSLSNDAFENKTNKDYSPSQSMSLNANTINISQNFVLKNNVSLSLGGFSLNFNDAKVTSNNQSSVDTSGYLESIFISGSYFDNSDISTLNFTGVRITTIANDVFSNSNSSTISFGGKNKVSDNSTFNNSNHSTISFSGKNEISSSTFNSDNTSSISFSGITTFNNGVTFNGSIPNSNSKSTQSNTAPTEISTSLGTYNFNIQASNLNNLTNSTTTFNGTTFNRANYNFGTGDVVFSGKDTFNQGGQFYFGNGNTIIFSGKNTINTQNNNDPFSQLLADNTIELKNNAVFNLSAIENNQAYEVLNTNGVIDYSKLASSYTNNRYRLIMLNGKSASEYKDIGTNTYDVLYHVGGQNITLKETFSNHSISVEKVANVNGMQAVPSIVINPKNSSNHDKNGGNTPAKDDKHNKVIVNNSDSSNKETNDDNPHIVSGNGSQEHHNNSNKNTNGGKSHTPSIPTPHNNQSPQPKTIPLSPTPPIPSTHQKDKSDNTPINPNPNRSQSKNQNPSADSTTNPNSGSNPKQSKNANPTSNPNPTTPTKIAINGTTITLAPNSFKINQTTTSLLQLQNNLSELKTALENQNPTLNSYENTKAYKEITKDLNNVFSLIKQVTSELNNNSKVSLISLSNQMSNANEALNTLVTQIQKSIDSSLSNGNDNKENLKPLANTLEVIQNASKVVHQAQNNVSQVATSSITYTQPTTQTQRTNNSAYGLDIQIGYKYFFGKKKHFGIRGYATYSYMYSSANTAINNKDNNLGKTNHHTYGAGFDFLYNFYESKNSLYTTGILLGVELLGSTWDNSNYALLNDYAKDIKALGGKAHLHTSAFQLPLVIGFRSNFSKHSGIELGFKIPLITNDYFTSNLKGYKETIIYRDNVNLYFNYVVNF
ncbi:outer membrane beta-barrel protein [Helicobacter cetorum]|uniref:Putative outer membrane protein n=1 Tax=Helicobacter cetorum (strain ATCC BAA-429 / MIT 00-7128) TaxID=182217 RepID=I0EK78_HELC0|nr:outer membrane beta-barrel protein [Helicobacter cetorum]AFI03347.1 putative outer membrane protein [Helicobacter cetorum MIT 00-7128]